MTPNLRYITDQLTTPPHPVPYMRVVVKDLRTNKKWIIEEDLDDRVLEVVLASVPPAVEAVWGMIRKINN